MKSLLEKLETRLQSLIESTLFLILGNSVQKTVAMGIINQLRIILEKSINQSEKIPNTFSITLHPEIYSSLGFDQDWITLVKEALTETALELGVDYSENISIQFFQDSNLKANEFTINFYSVIHEIERTAVLQTKELSLESNKKPSNAFLILPDRNIFPLSSTIVQIGRKTDNHLIIDNPTVSRNHAQIRNINGNFVIFDLNSTSGTFINGIRMKQGMLHPGDVISIANYPLIFGKETNDDDIDHGPTAEIPRIVDPK